MSGAFQELGEPLPQAPSLCVELVDDGFHFSDVALTAVNAFAMLRIEREVVRERVAALAAALSGFPMHGNDVRTWTLEPDLQSPTITVEASGVPTRCYALLSGFAGNISTGWEQPNHLRSRASICVRFDPASLDEFVAALRRIASLGRGRAVLFGRS